MPTVGGTIPRQVALSLIRTQTEYKLACKHVKLLSLGSCCTLAVKRVPWLEARLCRTKQACLQVPVLNICIDVPQRQTMMWNGNLTLSSPKEICARVFYHSGSHQTGKICIVYTCKIV